MTANEQAANLAQAGKKDIAIELLCVRKGLNKVQATWFLDGLLASNTTREQQLTDTLLDIEALANRAEHRRTGVHIVKEELLLDILKLARAGLEMTKGGE